MELKFEWMGDKPASPHENIISAGFVSELERFSDPRRLKDKVVKIILVQDDLHLKVTGTACSKEERGLFTLTYSLVPPNAYSCGYF